MMYGLRVVDRTTDIAGPYCTKVLADAGATVIRTEPETLDPIARHRSGALFDFLNADKVWSTTELAGELAAADVVVSYSAREARELHYARPDLVVVCITPFGIDGPWVDRAMLKIPHHQFLSCDLEKPFRMGRQFDLVVSVEVAEHLPVECAETFIDSLARLGPVVLFSAAITSQGGTNHVNEQWPDYWVRHFREKGYAAIDCLRKKIWQNDNVEWWYAQNVFIFARTDCLEAHPVLTKELERTAASQLSIVHPKAYLTLARWLESLSRMSNRIAELMQPGDPFILVDNGVFGNLLGAVRRPLPFPEINGEYGGPPCDAASAICELERQRELGAQFMIFTPEAFWWLEYYSELHQYLRTRFRCVLEDELLIAFNLEEQRPGTTNPAPPRIGQRR
jgi:hypothetical protein